MPSWEAIKLSMGLWGNLVERPTPPWAVGTGAEPGDPDHPFYSALTVVFLGILLLNPQYRKDTDEPEGAQERPLRCGGWSTCPLRRGWGSWACPAWSRVDFGWIHEHP